MENPIPLNSKPSKPLQSTLCPTCNKTFSTPINLRNHILTIHEHSFPFKCPFPSCNKSYSIETRLKVHIKTHLGNKPFKCDQCGKTFLEKGNLKTHIRFHSALRPFKCDLCNKSYKTNGHLKDHIDIQHHNIKKYHCSICGCNYGRSSTLKAHIRTHTGVKNIKCLIEGCDKYFSEKGNMLIHYKRHLMKVKHEKENNVMNDSGVNITRPQSNGTLVISEEQMENILGKDIYEDDNENEINISLNNIVSVVNDNSTSMISGSNYNNNVYLSKNDISFNNNKLCIGDDVQLYEKPFRENEFEKTFDFPYL